MNQETDRIKLHESWKQRLLPELTGPSMQALRLFLINERAKGRVTYPPAPLIFSALDATPFDAVKVVVLGQDPYIGPNQAHGMAFSVPRGETLPPSLLNIFKELGTDLAVPMPKHGNLESWAAQGVLLLNSVLTVAAGQSGSHQNKGWEAFTDRIVDVLNRDREHLVFLLWGSYAQQKGRLIDRGRHYVLKAPHPSPLSATRGFFGCRHFSQCNRYLSDKGKTPIVWALPD
jgi:uracil-DNA glycosylase